MTSDDLLDLALLSQSFLQGVDRSKRAVGELEKLIDECFADEDWADNTIEVLASFSPGESAMHTDENDVLRSLASVEDYVRTTLRRLLHDLDL